MKAKILAKLKSYGFWVSLTSAIMVFINTLGLKVDIPYLNQVTMAFLSILVVAGIITKPGSTPAGDAPDGKESQGKQVITSDKKEDADVSSEKSEDSTAPEVSEAAKEASSTYNAFTDSDNYNGKFEKDE